MEHQNPLVAEEIVGGDAYPEANYSLLEISNSNVLLSALKPAEDGILKGIVARVWNLSPNPESFNISLPSVSVATAKILTHIETPEADLPFSNGMLSDSLTSQQFRTYALQSGDFTDLTKNRVYMPLVENSDPHTVRPGIRPE